MKSFILIGMAIFYGHFCYAQDAPGKKKYDWVNGVKQTETIIEGHVINSKGFKTSNGIYTSDSVKVTKIFKGDISDSIIEVVFEGGTVDGDQVSISDGDVSIAGDGIYFLKKNTTVNTYRKSIRSYTTPFGSGNSIGYNIQPYHHPANSGRFYFDDIEKEIFEPIEAATGQKRKVLGPNIFEIEATKKKEHPDNDTLIALPNGRYVRVSKNNIQK